MSQKYLKIPVIVFGSTGFIGRWVARSLCNSGAELFLPVLDKNKASKIYNDFEIYGKISELNYEDERSVRRYITQIQPAIVFNLAGYGINRNQRNPDRAYYINGKFIKIIAEEISKLKNSTKWSGQRIIHTGSAMEYGSIKGNLHEDSFTQPTTLYGESKQMGTTVLSDFCKKNNLKGLTARLFAVYGPGELPERLLPTLIKQRNLSTGIEFTAGLHKRDFVYVEDVAEGLLRLGFVDNAKFNIVNLATGTLTSIRDFIEISASILGITKDRLNFGALPTRPEEMEHDPITNERLVKLTNWKPKTTIEEGIKRTLLFYKNTTAN